MFKRLLKNIYKKKEFVLLFFLLLLAGFLRLYKIGDYMTFLGDEGRDVLVVYKILHGEFTLLGPTASVGGFFMGPIYYYFMTPFLWLFNYNPVGPSVMVALFGIATVWLIYKFGSEFFNKKSAFIAALLYVVSPLVISYSRSSWNPNLMPFFSLLTLLVLYKAIKKNNGLLFIICGFLFGIDFQLHYIETFLGVVIAFYVFLHRVIFGEKQIIKKAINAIENYSFIVFGFLIGWSPFLLFEIRHGFPNTQSVINFIFHSGDTGSNPHFFNNILDVYFRLFARLLTKFPPPEQISLKNSIVDFDLFITNISFHISYLYYFTEFLMLGSTFLLVINCIKAFKTDKEKFLKLSLLLLWLFFGVFLFGFYKKPIYDYYFQFLFPLPFLLVGNLIFVIYTNLRAFFSKIFKLFSLKTDGFTQVGLIGKLLACAILIILVLLNLSGIPFRYPPNKQVEQVETISRFVFDKSDNKPFNFALITGGNSDHAYRYFFKLWNHNPLIIENTMVDPKRYTVTDQLLVVCEKNPCAPLGDSLWEVAGFGRAEIVGEWDVSVVKVYKLSHYKGK
ncbi:hypothetical protein C4559_05825 [Candidatus Microgenomates bacterium]|nr:MAG: hypothetical protein C4559_05825 [Candidatus Microgenomates bacterium]